MNLLAKQILAVSTAAFLSVSSLFSANYNLEKSTPVGSWQLREEITTDPKGKQVMSVIRTSLVGEETRGEIDYVWVETAMDTFKVKKGKKGNQVGEHTIVKILMEKSLMKGSPEEIFGNLRGLGEEIIMKTGDQEPMKIEKGGMMGDALLKGMGVEINYEFEDAGKETVETDAGKFKCKVVEGEGSVDMKVIFKTISVKGTSKQWISDKVPFGIVKQQSTSEMDGDVTGIEGKLLDFGDKGAVSEITGEVETLSIPGLGSLFGG